MDQYETMSTATKALHEKGFTEDFNRWENDLLLSYIRGEKDKSLEIVEFYRFEGVSDAGSNTIVYALETSDGKKGVLVDGYGTYSGQSVDKEVVKELAIQRQAYEKG
jgi:hypothetical protein